MPYNFAAIEKKWQIYWLENRSFRALEPQEAGNMPKAYILDMFPYPSGAGLHVGHPEGYTATDIVARFLRMRGHNVLHPMGWDAFGLPAEQYAISRNIHPRITTEQNIANFRRQIQMLGLSYDWDREIDTTDPSYYRWTQWIFLQLFNSYFDPSEQKAKPISHLISELENDVYVVAPDGSVHMNPVSESLAPITGEVRVERLWRDLTEGEQRDVIDSQRLAYMDEIPVNWCPGLGTVLANEEVIDGKSEVGGFPVIKQPMRQWMLRITAYSDRLLEDLDTLDWPESLKEMQRNWIGKSVGAEVDFDIDPATIPVQPEDAEDDLGVTVFTTRPDTLYGATYLVLSPEHPLVEQITSEDIRPAVDAYRQAVAARSERERMSDSREKTGIFTGAYALNPVNDEKLPIWIADYVLMGYGTGAIMAVPAHDQRDYEFARKFNLPIREVVTPPGGAPLPKDRAYEGEGVAINSLSLTGLPTHEAREQMAGILEAEGTGHRAVKYKLRDWLFSRQRYWGEPFPIILDAEGRAYAIPENQLPLALPEMSDFKPTGTPEPPLSKVKDWVNVTVEGQPAVRETNTMPQWAGSCWYYLRFIDPLNPDCLVDREKEKYWMPVDLYVGGVEHAVLHLLYARFWHKFLFDLGHVSTPEPFKRLVNQGLILGEMEFNLFRTVDGKPVSATELQNIEEQVTGEGRSLVGTRKLDGQQFTATRIEAELLEKQGDRYVLKSDPKIAVEARSFKMSKSRGNVVNPDQIVADFGADTFRLYEMYMGPLEAQKPWNTRDIVGMSRFLNSVHRNFIGDEEAGKSAVIVPDPIPDPLDRQLHRTIKKIGEDIDQLRFNTAIAELIKLNNEVTGLPSVSRALAETFTLLLAPFAPHLAEELWNRLGHPVSLSRHPWPKYDASKLIDSTLELPVQVNGKLRGTVNVPADADQVSILNAARAVPSVQPWLEGKTVAKELYIAKKMVTFVVK
ncbi:MAG: leucine--tRNA ligase [Planctomycetota bacterium]|nr:leucine--tRNA ligase [Planctomycetota bacterium]